MFACEQAPATPASALPPLGSGARSRVADIADIVCLSKGITGGYLPLAAVLCRDEIYAAFYDDATVRGFLHSHSYTGNPLACRAALAVLDLFEEEDVLEANRVRAERLNELLQPVAAHPRVAHFRHTGMIWAFDVIDAPLAFARDFHRDALAQGVLLRPIGQTVYFMPPYVIGEREIERLADVTLSLLDRLWAPAASTARRHWARSGPSAAAPAGKQALRPAPGRSCPARSNPIRLFSWFMADPLQGGRRGPAMPNRLAQETSPYLRQHADNPVDWYPWGAEVIARAQADDKPLLLSIGYASCHWCHVMAQECFADPEAAVVMNRHLVNVKVDREERPDLDQIYQRAHLLLTRRPGGWTLTVFLTPDRLPFFAGTYFPKTPRYGLPGFIEVLERIAAAYHRERGGFWFTSHDHEPLIQRMKPVHDNATPAGNGLAALAL
jgi:hypothetical protein